MRLSIFLTNFILVGILFACLVPDTAYAAGDSSASDFLKSTCQALASTTKLTDELWKKIRAKSAAGDADAQYLTGKFYDCGFMVAKDSASAVQWYKKSAALGYAKAMFALASHYSMGIGVEKNDKKAVALMNDLATQGYPQAQYSMAVAYANGEVGVAKNLKRSLDLLHKAAEQNYLPAEYRLGIYYEHGYGIQSDKAEAAKWFLRAADAGHAKSQAICGIYYASGTGVPVSYVEAAKWLMLAKHSIDPQSSLHAYVSKLLKTVSGHMNAKQIHSAQTEVALWLQSHHDASVAEGNAHE